MKRSLLILPAVIFGVMFFFSLSVAQCPEDTVDRGECDTLHLEIYPEDQEPTSAPFFVRFPIYITHDQVYDQHEFIDSIAGMYIILCYEHSNPSKYCSLSYYWNNTNLYSLPAEHSIFRHFIEGEDTLIHNWMMDLSQQGPGMAWCCIILNLDGTSHFWLFMTPTTQPLMGGMDKTLIATMTFKIEDTTTICIDTCWIPPGEVGVVFSRLDAKTYIPRHFFPVCEYVGWQGPPPVWFSECPVDEYQHTNGAFTSEEFEVMASDGDVVAVAAQFAGGGITNVNVAYTIPPPAPFVTGRVEYTVVDHCQGGGTITITAWDDVGYTDSCNFEVVLTNNPPVLNLPHYTWLALADYSMRLQVSADDPDNDSVEIVLDAFWHEPDSLQAPTNPPSYDGRNPGLFTWMPTEADTGVWIFSFSATDVCEAVDTHRVTILVGTLFCGDCTDDELIDLGDVIYLMSYLFRGGSPPDPVCKGEVNCDDVVNLGDLVYLIHFLFRFGPAPCFECCAGMSGGTFIKPDSPD